MARGQIVAKASSSHGAKLNNETTGVPADGHYVVNSGKTKLLVRNSNGASTARTVTFLFSRTVDGQGVEDLAVAIPAGETWVFGPFDRNDYGSQLNIDVDNAELMLRAIE